MVSMFTSSLAVSGLRPGRVKPKSIKLLFAASPLSSQHQQAQTGWLRIWIMFHMITTTTAPEIKVVICIIINRFQCQLVISNGSIIVD